MKISNILRLLISYLFLIAAGAVYFVWHFLWLELILIAGGFIILISALQLHLKDRKAADDDETVEDSKKNAIDEQKRVEEIKEREKQSDNNLKELETLWQEVEED
jgi:hypothetical protein